MLSTLNKRPRLARRERVKIFIGGVPAATTDRDLELFLTQQAGGQPGLKFAFESRISWRFAVVEGTGAHRAVLAMVRASAGGSEDGRYGHEVKLHDRDWFCPCGLSGDLPLFDNVGYAPALCPSCRSTRPPSLEAAVKVAAEAATSDSAASAAAAVSPAAPAPGFLRASSLLPPQLPPTGPTSAPAAPAAPATAAAATAAPAAPVPLPVAMN